MSEQSRTVVDVIIEDHREVEELFRQAQAAADRHELRRATDLIIAELVRHSVAEEQYLYPALREHLDDGDQLADQEIAEHAEAEELMKRLETLSTASEHFRPALEKLMSDVRQHIEEEKNDTLPRLAAACPHDQLVQLADEVEHAKESGPTRPHPSAPDTPPWNKILAPGAGLVDRVRDAFAGRST